MPMPGDTTILCVAKADFRKILGLHTELYEAIAAPARAAHPTALRAGGRPQHPAAALAAGQAAAAPGAQLRHSQLSHGDEIRIGLQLAQEELAQLLGASRQRVNQELKAMEREDIIRIEPGGLVVRDRERSCASPTPIADALLHTDRTARSMSNFDHFVGTRPVSISTPSTSRRSLPGSLRTWTASPAR